MIFPNENWLAKLSPDDKCFVMDQIGRGISFRRIYKMRFPDESELAKLSPDDKCFVMDQIGRGISFRRSMFGGEESTLTCLQPKSFRHKQITNYSLQVNGDTIIIKEKELDNNTHFSYQGRPHLLFKPEKDVFEIYEIMNN